uniref:Uncharacterized protein n=1 Tax=Solanum lycopersicum TaxID=4081 RepID=A0A3Q7JBI1_SOLLC
MSESSCGSISNSMTMTYFCGELTRCFTSRTPLNLKEDFIDVLSLRLKIVDFGGGKTVLQKILLLKPIY